MMMAIGVPGTRILKKFETLTGKLEDAAAKFTSVFRATSAMTIVPAVILAPAIVKKREQSNQLDIGSATRG